METARLFRNGKSQAGKLPEKYQFEGNKVYIKKMGNAVVLIPVANSWQPLIESLPLFTEDFMSDRD
jgi:antitoxin VapB